METNTEKKYNIILIENNTNMQRLLTNTFLKMGIEMTAANNIIESNNILNTNDYDLIITMLDDDWTECFSFCERIRAKYSMAELPIIGYSSKINPQLVIDALSVGYNDVFSLPFNIVEFKLKIKFLLEVKKISDKVKTQQSIIETRTQVFKMNTHDLKNPLSSIFSLSGIPMSSFNDTDEIAQTMAVIHNASKIMMSLVNSNLEFLNVTSDTIVVTGVNKGTGQVKTVLTKHNRLRKVDAFKNRSEPTAFRKPKSIKKDNTENSSIKYYNIGGRMYSDKQIIVEVMYDLIHLMKLPNSLNECLVCDEVLDAMVIEAKHPSQSVLNESKDELVELMYEDYLNGNLDEGLIGMFAGGLTGFLLGTRIGKLICKILGIEENGPLGRLLTSKMTATAIGVALGKGKKE